MTLPNPSAPHTPSAHEHTAPKHTKPRRWSRRAKNKVKAAPAAKHRIYQEMRAAQAAARARRHQARSKRQRGLPDSALPRNPSQDTIPDEYSSDEAPAPAPARTNQTHTHTAKMPWAKPWIHKQPPPPRVAPQEQPTTEVLLRQLQCGMAKADRAARMIEVMTEAAEYRSAHWLTTVTKFDIYQPVHPSTDDDQFIHSFKRRILQSASTTRLWTHYAQAHAYQR